MDIEAPAASEREDVKRYIREKGVPQLVEHAVRYLSAARPESALDGLDSWVCEARVKRASRLGDEVLAQCKLGPVLGKGSFAKVYLGLMPDGRYIAVKRISLAEAEEAPEDASTSLEEEIASARNEFCLMTTVSHVNIVQCLGFAYDSDTRCCSIFMEYVGGRTLAEVCQAFNGLPKDVVRDYTLQIVKGLRALHTAKICHRDIKPENVLTDPSRRLVKLCDFGCGKQIDGLKCGKRGRACMTVAGTPYYMSPEILTDEAGYDGMRADVWSLGATVIQMVTGSLPWPKSHSSMAAIFMISQAAGPPSACPDAEELGGLLHGFINCCCCLNPAERPMTDELLLHPYLL